MTVTKQQQLEWLAKAYKTWPEQGSHSLRLSAFEVGKFTIVNCHVITRKEWQQERDRQAELKVMTMKMCELKPLERYKMSGKPEVDNSWHERGEFPPVGAICEMIDDKNTWLECEIVSHKDGACIGWISSRKAPFYTYDKSEFRPLRTEREKAIDDMVYEFINHYGDPKGGERYLPIASKLYDAGYRKVKP